jgi:hypothetical protein
VRISGAYSVRGDPCDGLRMRIHVFGTADCDPPGTPCIRIAYTADLRVKHPRGC